MKVVIIDDHPLVRRGLKDVLSLEEQYVFSGEARNVDESLTLLNKVEPELVLVDLRLGNEWGLEVIESARANGLGCKFVLLTSSATKEDFMKAKEAKVDGFINKSALPDELLYAIRVVGQGKKYYDPAILDLMMDTAKEKADQDVFVEQLTAKEMEVLKLLGMGYSNKMIARELFVTEYTVKKHVSQILAKLGLADRTQAALYANQMGIAKFAM